MRKPTHYLVHCSACGEETPHSRLFAYSGRGFMCVECAVITTLSAEVIDSLTIVD